MELSVEITLDETWTGGKNEDLDINFILSQAVILRPGVQMKVIYTHKTNLISLDKLEQKVCIALGVTPKEIMSKKRDMAIVEARQILHYVAYQNGFGSQSSIGFRYGRKDHSTVRYSVINVENYLKNDKRYINKYKSLIDGLLV